MRIKTEAFFHLTNTLVYPLMVLLTLLIYPIFYMYSPVDPATRRRSSSHDWGHFLFSVSLFVLATCSASTFFIFGQRELFGKEAGWKTILYLPFLMSLGVGVGLNNAKAVFEAIWGAIRSKPSEFVRTPKYGVTGHQQKWKQRPHLHPQAAVAARAGNRHGLLHAGSASASASWWNFGQSSIPFLLIFAGGYFYVGFSSLHALHMMNRCAQAANELPEPAIEPVST